MSFFAELFARRAKTVAQAATEAQTHHEEYRGFLARVAADQRLSSKDAARFEALMVLTGTSAEMAEAQAGTLRRAKVLEPLAAKVGERRAALAKREEDLEAEVLAARFKVERLRLANRHFARLPTTGNGALESRIRAVELADAEANALAADWLARAQIERTALNEAEAAAGELSRIRSAHAGLFGGDAPKATATETVPTAKPTPPTPAPKAQIGSRYGTVEEFSSSDAT